MIIRTLSAVIALPFLIFAVICGGALLKIGIAAVSILGLYEFYHAIEGKIMPLHIISFIMTAIYIFMLDIQFNMWFALFMNLFILLIMCYQIKFHKTINIKNIAVTLLGFFYITFTFSNIYILRNTPYHMFNDFGLYIVWLVFISAWCCDTGAYFFGMFLGKHKLAPVLSPKKTVEGAIGGVFSAAVGGGLYGIYINCAMLEAAQNFSDAGINIIFVSVVFAAAAAIFSQLGDLTASAIKRYVNIKDFGSIMPGHGGILDRFDSVIFTSAAIYILSQYLVML